jgi:hypothetical protein
MTMKMLIPVVEEVGVGAEEGLSSYHPYLLGPNLEMDKSVQHDSHYLNFHSCKMCVVFPHTANAQASFLLHAARSC